MMIRPMELPRIRTTPRLLAGLVAIASACGGSAAELRQARRSGYQADFAIVFSETLAAVAKLYPQLDEQPDRGRIQTSWHPISVRTVIEGEEGGYTEQQRDAIQTGAVGDPLHNTPNALGSRTYQRKRYFIRFDVDVIGGNPWQVRVVGKAKVWEEGSVPVELRGADAPHWLAGRTDALRVAIHRRLKRYAVLLPEAPDAEGDGPKPADDLGRFGPIPAAAARAVAAVHAAAVARDFDALRAQLSPRTAWSLGAPPDAEQALAMWRADSQVLGSLAEVLEAGCRLEDPARVTCPPAYSQQPGYLGYRAGFEPIGGEWKLVFFVTGD
jgi:hypothetical protein